MSRAFEEGRDEIRFRGAVAGGHDYRTYHEAQSVNDATGKLFPSQDLPDRQNTVLQIDHDGNGFDSGDYFLVVLDAELSLHGFILT